MKILLPSNVQKSLDKIPDKTAFTISIKIKNLAENPFPDGYQKLRGELGYRIRIGDYRVVYVIDSKKQIITIIKVAHRRDVYR